MAAIPDIVKQVVGAGVLRDAPHATLVYDLDEVRRRIADLQAAFPGDTLHTLAVKACPISELLRRTRDLGCGAEAASAVELQQALRVGIAPTDIVFDSPAKTVEELRFALRERVHVNADSLQELDRIAEHAADLLGDHGSVGVRVNPAVGVGAIEATSTAMPGSKFGVSLHDDETALVERFARYPWLTGVHVHVGSQGCDLPLLTEGVARVLDFANRVEQRVGAGRIRTFDLGGGLPATYRPEDPKPSFGGYAQALLERTPGLFDGSRRLITEFGRAVWANSGVAISRVEYTKQSHGRAIAVVHLGADMFPRTAYVPSLWHHEVSVFDAHGQPKSGDEIEQDIAGPLCFSGDLIARARRLPPIEPGDHVAVHDAGAYTLGMWSRYNSRQSPPVFGSASGHGALELLRKRESVEDVLEFWD